jgi:hypothetical protein
MRLVQPLKTNLWTNLENVKTSTLEGKKNYGYYACREDITDKQSDAKNPCWKQQGTDTKTSQTVFFGSPQRRQSK